MSMFGKKELPPPMPEPVNVRRPEVREHERAPIEFEPPPREDGSARDAVIQAAREHARQEQRIDDLTDLLQRARAELEAAGHQIGELQLLLAQERNYVASYKAERDEAVQDRANAVSLLANISALIERGVTDGDIPRKASKRSGRAATVVAAGNGGGASSDPSPGGRGGGGPEDTGLAMLNEDGGVEKIS